MELRITGTKLLTWQYLIAAIILSLFSRNLWVAWLTCSWYMWTSPWKCSYYGYAVHPSAIPGFLECGSFGAVPWLVLPGLCWESLYLWYSGQEGQLLLSSQGKVSPAVRASRSAQTDPVLLLPAGHCEAFTSLLWICW